MADTRGGIDSQYQSLKPALQRLEIECRYIVEDALQQAGIKIHSVLSRVKTLESVREKIVRKENAGSLEDIDDLFGIRIVCLLRSDIARIGELVRTEFEVLSEDNKLDGANIEAFGYQSVHFVAKLNASCKGRRYDGLHGQAFEVQVRTVAMDAWATLSHYLDYKNEIDVPKELRKDFFALSGLFYVADTHFEMFYDARKRSSTAAQAEIMTSFGKPAELNFDTLSAYLEQRYPDRSEPSAEGVSKLLGELIDSGYADFQKIESALDSAEIAFQKYEEDHPPSNEKRYNKVGAMRTSLAIADHNYMMAFRKKPNGIEVEYRHLLKASAP